MVVGVHTGGEGMDRGKVECPEPRAESSAVVVVVGAMQSTICARWFLSPARPLARGALAYPMQYGLNKHPERREERNSTAQSRAERRGAARHRDTRQGKRHTEGREVVTRHSGNNS